MTWQPTEGEKRTTRLIDDLEIEAIQAGIGPGSALMKARLFCMIAKAIDDALAEVPANAREALDKAMMDNFPGALAGEVSLPPGTRVEFHGSPPIGWKSVELTKNGIIAEKIAGNGHANPDDYSELSVHPLRPRTLNSDVAARSATADLTYKGAPVVFDRIDDPHVLPADPGLMQDASHEQVAKLFEDAPKKRRGRPPGSKAKAAKPAKAKRSRSDKLLAKIANERAPVLQALADAPVAETVTATVPEQSEAPQ